MLRLGADRTFCGSREPGGLCKSGAHAAGPGHHGGLRSAQIGKREVAGERAPRGGQGGGASLKGGSWGRFMRMIVGLFVSIVAGALTLALLSARWAVGRFDEAAAAPDPVAPLEDVVTMLFYSVQLAPGLTLLPPLAAVLLGEVLRIRSLLYYV